MVGRKRRRSGRPPALHLQRGSASFAERVREVGAEHFGILAVDCHKERFAVLLANFHGQVLMDMQVVENTGPALEGLVVRLKEEAERHGLADLVVAIERTGRYYRPIRTVLGAHWTVLLVHPFATKQLRQPADPGNKTDRTDLLAMVRAIQVGFGTREAPLGERGEEWLAVSRWREDLVRKRAEIRVQAQERLEALLPGYTRHFKKIWEAPAALALAVRFGSAAALLEAGPDGLAACLRNTHQKARQVTILRALQWARGAAPADPAAKTNHRIFCEQLEMHCATERAIYAQETRLLDFLADSPAVLLTSIPGINVVSSASYGAELGPIENYLAPTKIAGRAGLYPSRSQSDQTDHANGPLVGHRNARLRDAILEIAHNLITCNEYFKAWAQVRRDRGWPEKRVHVAVARKFTRISYAMLRGRTVFSHPCSAGRDALLRKLYRFGEDHDIDPGTLRDALLRAARQIPAPFRPAEADALLSLMPRQSTGPRRRPRIPGPEPLSAILPDLMHYLVTGLPLPEERSRPDRPPNP
jgi:transposase